MSQAASRLAGFLALAVLCAACGQSHTNASYAGVDGSERLVELRDDQWVSLCGWIENLRASEALLYECDATGTAPTPVAVSPPSGFYDWTSTFCYESRLGERSWWRRQDATCATTVAEWAACWESRAELVCYAMHGWTPECIRHGECWLDFDEPDAGAE